MNENITKKDTHLEAINNRLDELIPANAGPYGHLFEAARYALLGPGKRIRPLMTVATAQALGSTIEDALTPACALEMVHTYSLIHDDLPCMDDDDFRRGRPTLHRVYPEGHAVLTGDYLLTKAFEVLANAPSLQAEQRVQLIKTLAERSGSHGMIAGQVMDIASEGQQIDLATLEHIHLTKTAALITAALEFGAITANATSALPQLQRCGRNIGLAFQIIDDVLDVTSSAEKHGKAVSSDIINNKSTYVTLLGIQASKEAAIRLHHEACTTLEDLGIPSSSLIYNLIHGVVGLV